MRESPGCIFWFQKHDVVCYDSMILSSFWFQKHDIARYGVSDTVNGGDKNSEGTGRGGGTLCSRGGRKLAGRGMEWRGVRGLFFHGRPVRGACRGMFWMLIDGVLVCVNFIRRSVPLTGRISRDTENGLPGKFFFQRDR